MTFNRTYAGLALLGASALFAGCSGNSQMPATGGMPPGATSMQSPSDHGRDHRGCPNDGGVTVTPCHITFDTNNPGPATVMVTHDGRDDRGRDRQRIVERDNCASRNIATIARNSNRVYTVAAGAVAGSCSARFSDDGNGNDDSGPGGDGNLRIVNNL
jgi:hypothetical protein